MEEASVAGESPGKSKQQESSGTARSESDPRLAVFREPSADGAAGTKTDTATAVFRTTPSENGEGAKTDTATAAFRASPSGGGESGDKGTGGDDSEPSADAGADASAETEAEPGVAAEAEGSDGAVGAEEAADAKGAAKDAGRPEKAPEASESAAAAEPADAAADEAAAEPVEGVGSTGEGDARLRAAVAAWVSKDDDADEDAKGGASKDDDGAKGGASEDGAAKDTETGAAAEGGASDDAAADAATASSGADDADKDAGEPSGDKASSDEKKKADDADAKGAGKDKGADEAKGAGKAKGADGKQGVDQPTAIFRSPAAPKADQPTTALKIPPTEPKAGAKPESAAERTSKFVPLRGDDVRPTTAPAPRKPETPAAPASPAAAERTTQQPMPPKPPLDLLAELTNTPPPPETPVRTAVRRVKIWTPLVLLLLIVFAIAQLVRPLPEPELQMSAKPTYTFEGSKPSLPWPNEGQGYMAATGLGPVGSFGEQKAVPIGSVAKAMTAYIVLKDHPLKKGEEGPSIEVDAAAEKEGGYDAVGESTLSTVKKGDKLTLKQALSAIMIPSANNIARLLARWDAGSEEAFVKKMNDTAKSLGMKNTTYTDPSGLNATTVSSAEDQVKLGEKLVEIPALMAITVLPSWTDPSGHEWRNWNSLVPFNGSLGIKTGSTTKAGGNLLFAAHKMVGDTDQLIVGAVLGQHKNPIIDTVNAVSKDVMIATQDLLKNAKVIKKGDVVGTVSDGLGGSTPVVATKDVSAVGWSGLTVKLELNDDGKTIPHSAAAGTHVGTLTVGEGRSQVKVPVALKSDLTEPKFGDKLTRLG
ncbi:serine hydrolase [Streptomyces sp. NPDC015032]|uniref:serine hydrolase n=1 Tax=Streptomyces sp. NPDC015032 TaxID=3364937 RepID=UPI0037003422